MTVDVSIDEAAAIAKAMALPRVRELVGEKEPAKIIYVPGRLINIVVR
jgi:leucyl-tRNA synthetase